MTNSTWPNQSSRLVLFSAAFYLLLVAYLLISIVRATGGHFVYPLDDSYIHLAMAENLVHGHYGINLSEFSSPSSSILWPFLLIPFTGTSLHVYVPVLLNLLFGLASACLIGRAVARWPPQVDQQGVMPWWQQAFTAALLIFVANLAGLTVLGMEHVLQVLLAICCAVGVGEALSDRPIPAWCLAAAVIAPLVRYEDLFLLLAVCATLAGLRQWRKVLIVVTLGVAPLLAFSVYLRTMGLPLLPMSLMVKGSLYGTVGLGSRTLRMLQDNLRWSLVDPERVPVVLLSLTFLGLAWKAPTRLRRYIFGGVAALGVLQLTLGHFGWFYRYEVYALIFLTLLCLRVLAERPRFLFGFYALALMFCASPYIRATATTAAAANDIYEQQYQMHRFVTRFYKGDYAVQDLGLVSFQRRPGAYVLDLFGLGSLEASRQSDKSAEWLATVVQRHQIPLVIVYPNWRHIPTTWTPLARMCSPTTPVFMASGCIAIFSTIPDRESEILTDLQAFSTTLPAGVRLSLARAAGPDPAK
ncbi:hypothetical protein [Granulicella arctica]|uniref:hypothetical protein n=1 Tax=Granulicella arctica TaxID=940613 RepID=UPI0021DFE113|nr:hypothetical protein [Granulicella arctica]